MQSLGCITIRQMGFFHGVKTPKVDDFFVVGDRGLPTFISIFHPRKTAHTFNAVLVGASAIRPILTMSGFTEVFKSVVRFVSVDVVNLRFWRVPSDIKPRKPMGRIRFSINFNVNVTFILFQISSLLAHLNLWSWRRPLEKTRCWIIGKDGCKIRMFHASILPEHETDCKTEGDLNV